ncbi:hypothetical protein NUSPORA_01719 [Nucleospora cyclopteri]
MDSFEVKTSTTIENDKLFVGLFEGQKAVLRVQVKNQAEEKLREMISKKQTVNLSNGIYKTLAVDINAEMEATLFCPADEAHLIPVGYKYVIEKYEDHLKKEFEAISMENYQEIYKSSKFSIFKNDQTFLTVLKEQKSFREIKSKELVEEMLKKTKEFAIGKEICSFFNYEGSKKVFHFITSPINLSLYSTPVTFIDEFIKNLSIKNDFYDKNVHYIEKIYE